jgi:hypothetical protein
MNDMMPPQGTLARLLVVQKRFARVVHIAQCFTLPKWLVVVCQFRTGIVVSGLLKQIAIGDTRNDDWLAANAAVVEFAHAPSSMACSCLPLRQERASGTLQIVKALEIA